MTLSNSEKYIVLETFRKNGKAVKTPVWFVIYQNDLWFVTREKTGKVKRIRNNGNIRFALSNFFGNPKDKWVSGIAEKIQNEKALEIINLRNKKYGFFSKIIGIFSSSKGDYAVYKIKES